MPFFPLYDGIRPLTYTAYTVCSRCVLIESLSGCNLAVTYCHGIPKFCRTQTWPLLCPHRPILYRLSLARCGFCYQKQKIRAATKCWNGFIFSTLYVTHRQKWGWTKSLKNSKQLRFASSETLILSCFQFFKF